MAGKQDAATKQVTTSTRKRRRKSTWATGVIKKPKQSKKPKVGVEFNEKLCATF